MRNRITLALVNCDESISFLQNKARKWSCFKQLEQEGDDMLGALFLTTKSAKSSK